VAQREHAENPVVAVSVHNVLGELNEEQVRALTTVSKHSDDLLEMIEGLMETTRIQAGEVRIENRSVDLVSLLNDLRSRYDALPRGAAVRLSWLYSPDLPKLETDESKLMRILQNLISNAIKFTDQGCITVSATHLLDESAVAFRIEDTGIGIPHESQAVIFEIFRQLDSSRTRAYGGIGLGLYIVKQLAVLIGATVTVQSTPACGSVFTFTVPLVSKDAVRRGPGALHGF
jgi:signal transduction histidine kinase